MAQQYTNWVEFDLSHTTVAKAYNKVTQHVYLGKPSIKINSTLLQLTVGFFISTSFLYNAPIMNGLQYFMYMYTVV